MRYAKHLFISFLLVCVLTACGFHLRGLIDMPPWLKDVAIIVEKGHRDLPKLLGGQLEAYKVNVVEIPQAKHILTIKDDIYQEQITSVSSTTTPRQYQINYSVFFMLQGAKGKTLIPAGAVTVTRQLTINSDRILGSDSEEALIKSEMRQEAAMLIINRLSKTNKESI